LAAARIALDAFGGDHCPRAEVQGAIEAARQGVNVVLVGDERAIEAELATVPDRGSLPLTIKHAPDRITMEDHPGRAIRAKPDASMPVCFDLVKKGEADAAMSAGNSGAMMACGLFKYRRLKGVDRPAIVTSMPNKNGYTALLDVGANVDCRPVNFVQWAVMGAVFARFRHGKVLPRVAVLSNGTEDGKGTELTRAVHALLSEHESPDFVYAGYAEGSGLFSGELDVIVTDGFTGNVALKVAEATGRLVGHWLREAITSSTIGKLGALMLKPSLKQLRENMNPDSYGAAPLLGVDGVAFICHGGASPFAIATALQLAVRSVDEALTPAVADALARNADLVARAKEGLTVAPAAAGESPA
jgi:glycerol-3-phosphate acyltransferase PlsX